MSLKVCRCRIPSTQNTTKYSFAYFFLTVLKLPSVRLKVTKLSSVTSDLKIVTVMSKVSPFPKNMRHSTHS